MRGIHKPLLCAWVLIALLLASCASIPPQQQVRDFPLLSLEALVPPGLSSEKSGNAAFPDFYLMMDQQAAPKMWESLSVKLPELLGGVKAGGIPGFDSRLASSIQRLVLFRPQAGVVASGGGTEPPSSAQNGLQGLLFGTLPVCPIRAALENQHDWHETMLEVAGHG